MASYDRKFEIVKPDLEYLIREVRSPAVDGLVIPDGTSPVPLIDGELVQFNSEGKYARMTDATAPSFFVLDERGAPVVRSARKFTAIMGGSSFFCRTIVYDTALTTLNARVGAGAVNNSLSGTVARTGLIAASTNWVLGVIIEVASAANGNRLGVFITGL